MNTSSRIDIPSPGDEDVRAGAKPLDGVAKFFQRGPTTIRALDGVDHVATTLALGLAFAGPTLAATATSASSSIAGSLKQPSAAR